MKRASISKKLERLRQLRQEAELEKQIVATGPLDEDLAQTKALGIARKYHDLLWAGVPSTFNNFAHWNYLTFKSMKTFTFETLKTSYPDNTIENMLNDVIAGLNELEKYQTKQLGLGLIVLIRNLGRSFKTQSQYFLRRNPNFLAIIIAVAAVLTLAAMLFFNLPLFKHK
jgi:hypothetical protein